MTLYVKELDNILTIKDVSVWTKTNINLKPFVSSTQLQADDIIIVSKNDFCDESVFSCATLLIFEEFIEKILNNIHKELITNYDYYYLKNALCHAKEPSVDTIITGSSYGIFGIDTSILSTEVNISLISQDLYYSLKGIEDVCTENDNIKNIVLCCGYYYFYSDLSKTQNPQEIRRVSKVYYPIYNDLHNCTLLPAKDNVLFESNIFDIKKIMKIYSDEEYKKQYFYVGRERENFQTKVWADKTKLWAQLTNAEKVLAAKERTQMHNKIAKRKISLAENTFLFNKLVALCNAKKINLIVIVTPTHRHYQDNLWTGYKEIFYNILNNADGIVHLADLFSDPSFNDEDFNDTDHLNKQGATKMTNIILNLLHKLNND